MKTLMSVKASQPLVKLQRLGQLPDLLSRKVLKQRLLTS